MGEEQGLGLEGGVPLGSWARQKPLEYRTRSLQRRRLLSLAFFVCTEVRYDFAGTSAAGRAKFSG